MVKRYRNTIAALVLATVLATATLAGEIHTGVTGTGQQPPPTASSTTETATSEAVDTSTAIALTLLQSVLSLL